MFHWRFGIGWWLVVLFGLPVIALLLGLIFGGSLQTADLGLVLIKQLGSIVLAVVVINLRKETVWAGFFQTRLEARFNFGVAAVLTTVDRRTDRGRHCGRGPGWRILRGVCSAVWLYLGVVAALVLPHPGSWGRLRGGLALLIGIGFGLATWRGPDRQATGSTPSPAREQFAVGL